MFTKCFEEGRAVADQPPADGGDSTKGEQSTALGTLISGDFFVYCQLLYIKEGFITSS